MSWKGDTNTKISNIENDVASIETTVTPTKVYADFLYLDAGGEQTIFELTNNTKTFVTSIMLDLTNMNNNGTLKLYSKINTVNYVLLHTEPYVNGTDDPGFLITYEINLIGDFKITYEEASDEGGDITIAYNYTLKD